MKTVVYFDTDVEVEVAKRSAEWLVAQYGNPFFAYLRRECERHHHSALNAMTDNPIRDVLVSQRELAAEQVIRDILLKVEEEAAALKTA